METTFGNLQSERNIQMDSESTLSSKSGYYATLYSKFINMPLNVVLILCEFWNW